MDGGTARAIVGVDRAADLPAGALDRRRQASRSACGPNICRSPAQGPFATSGVVELVERLGKSSFAHVRRVDDKMLVVEVRGRDTPAVTENVTFRAPLQDIHVFDASGQRVPSMGDH